ncbi:MAG: hypothetical protein J6Y00_08040 [Paludibacteraceae bacterium]|nr:hypothetical protein [Paludibacteraceae bacterium]
METLAILDAEEREQLLGIWNLIPVHDRQAMTQEDVLFVLDAMDDYLESIGLLEVDEKTGEVTYLDGDVDETEQLNYIIDAQKCRHSSSLTSSQIQIILDAELQYGISQGYYEEEE